jgi:hypothetical protein
MQARKRNPHSSLYFLFIHFHSSNQPQSQAFDYLGDRAARLCIPRVLPTTSGVVAFKATKQEIKINQHGGL